MTKETQPLYTVEDMVRMINYRITSPKGISKHEIHMVTNVILDKANDIESNIVDDMMFNYRKEIGEIK